MDLWIFWPSLSRCGLIGLQDTLLFLSVLLSSNSGAFSLKEFMNL